MHELTIASHVIEIVEENLKSNNALRATSVTLDVGSLSGVVIYALENALNHLIRDTINSGMVINIKEIQGKARCNNCAAEFDVPTVYEICPFCESYDSEIIRGEELIIKSIEIEEN